MPESTMIKPLAAPDDAVTRDFTFGDAEWRDDAETGGMRFEGMAAVFDSPSGDLGGFIEYVERGAFRKVLNTQPDVRLLFNHDSNFVLARTRSQTMQLRETPEGLHVTADIAPTTMGRDLATSIRRGDVDQMSFGFKVGQGNDAWEQRGDGQVVRRIKNFDALWDVSVVTLPAYEATTAQVRSMVRGVQIITPTGDVNEDELRSLAFAIQIGEIDATPEERAAIDAAFARIELVSPWTAQRAAALLETDSELRDLLNPPAAGVAFRLASRRRRLDVKGLGLGIRPEHRKVVDYQDLPLAPLDTPWNETEAQKRVATWAEEQEDAGEPADDTDEGAQDANKSYASAFLDYDASSPDTDEDDGFPDDPGAYRLQIADIVDGELVAVPKAIVAAANKVQGGRAGLGSDTADIPAIKGQIARYYAKMRQKFSDDSLSPPWMK